jgi:hypothetical protein
VAHLPPLLLWVGGIRTLAYTKYFADSSGRHFEAVIKLELHKISAFFIEKEEELEVRPSLTLRFILRRPLLVVLEGERHITWISSLVEFT